MPRVPTYQPQVSQGALPSVRLSGGATSESFGGGTARAIGQIGQTFESVGLALTRQNVFDETKTRLMKDKAFAREGINFSSSALRQKASELYRLKGKEAVDAYNQFEKFATDLRKSQLKDLENDQQRDFFSASYDSLASGHLNRTMAFQEKALVDYERMTLDAQNKNAVEEAVAAWEDPSTVSNAEAVVTANTRHAQRGMGKDITDKSVEDAVNNLHSNVMSSISQESPSEAKKYLQGNWDKFNPGARDKLLKDISEMSLQEKSRDQAIVLSASNMSLEDQLKEVDKIKDPKEAALTRSLVKSRNNEKVAIKKAEEKQYVETEWDNLFESPKDYKIPLELPANEQKSMQAYKVQALKEWEKNKGIGAGASTDWNTYTRLMLMPEGELSKLDLTPHIKNLAPSEYKALITLQRKLRFPTGSEQSKKAKRVRTVYQQASQALKGIDEFNIKEEGEDAATRTNQFYEQYSTRINQIPAEERTEEKVGEVIRDLLSPVSVDTGWFDLKLDKNFYRFETPYQSADIEEEVYTQNIPASLDRYTNVKFHKGTGRYYVDGDGVRKVFDTYGVYIESFRTVRGDNASK